MDSKAFLAKLRDSYEYYFDVSDGDIGSGLPLSFFAEFHARDEGYVLVKSAKIWFAESNEYVYVFDTPTLDAESAGRCIDYALADGLSRIKPGKDHRDSCIIAVFAADQIDAEAQKVIRDRKFYKSYKYGLEGWSSLKVAGAETGKGLIVTNKTGRELVKFLKKVLRSETV